MTRVMIVVADSEREVQRIAATHELVEADMVIRLGEDLSEGEVIKDRFGKNQPVKVVTK